MKKKNGFTLIELLAVVVILGIISAIATTIYSGYIQSTRMKTYIAAEKSMVSSTTSLLQQCREKEEDGEICELTDKSIPSVGATGIVYLKQLVENGYMKDVKDPKDTSKSCAEESYVLIKGLDSNSLNSKTEYQACLICGDYVSENCSAIDYAAVEKPIIVGKNSNGTNLISGGWLYKGNGTLEATYDKQLSGELNYKYKWYKDGNLIGGANKKKINVTEEGIYKVNVSNELETRNIDSDDFIVKTDNTAPANVDFSYLTTTKSITVTAIGTSLSKLSYSFSNNNGSTWTAYQDSNIYTFDKLKSGTYNVKVKVKNMSMLETISNVKSVILPVINVPTYSINYEGWSQSKIVTINYQNGYTNEYSLDNGETWKEYTKPILFNSNGTIIARISDNINSVVGSTLSVTNIDTTGPVLTLPTLTTNYQTSIGLTSGATISDPESGIASVVIKYNGNVVTNANEFTYPGTYLINITVTNGVGMVSTGNRTVVVNYTFAQAFGYTGGAQTFTAPINGYYKLEVWGAQGNGNAKGGYSTGALHINKGTVLYVYVGGKGQVSSTAAFNGGGLACAYLIPSEYIYGGGGGATDIRTTTSVSNRIIVAGGSGAAYWPSSSIGGYGAGGGASGGPAAGYFSITNYYNSPATGVGGQGYLTNCGCIWGSCQNSDYSSTFTGGGGGGYVGGRGIKTAFGGMSWNWPTMSNGVAEGGSGYIGGVTSYGGITAQTISGNLTMPYYNGTSTMVGNSGSGYAKITLIKYD